MISFDLYEIGKLIAAFRIDKSRAHLAARIIVPIAFDLIQTEPFRRCRTDQSDVFPGNFRQRSRQFLKPSIICKTPVIDARVGQNRDFQIARRRGICRLTQKSRIRRKSFRRKSRIRNKSVVNRFAPVVFKCFRRGCRSCRRVGGLRGRRCLCFGCRFGCRFYCRCRFRLLICICRRRSIRTCRRLRSCGRCSRRGRRFRRVRQTLFLPVFFDNIRISFIVIFFEKCLNYFIDALAAVESFDQRLNYRNRAVKGACVAPCFEKMFLRNMPVTNIPPFRRNTRPDEYITELFPLSFRRSISDQPALCKPDFRLR